jgi:hypothetical protein
MDPNVFRQELEFFHQLDPEMQTLEAALGLNSATASCNVSYWNCRAPSKARG